MKKFLKIVSLVFSGIVLLAPTLVSATSLSMLFGNGLAGSTTLPQLIFNIVQLMLGIAFGIALVFIIIGGYFYLTAQGNEEQAEKGRTAVTNAVIGIIVIIMSYAIVSVVQNTVLLPGSYNQTN